MLQLSSEKEDRLCQGDIYRDIHFVEEVIVEGDAIDVRRVLFPFVIVLTQDCDLQQDHSYRWPLATDKKRINHDKRILSALVAPIYNAEHFATGSHLEQLQMKMGEFAKKSRDYGFLTSNQNQRYHFLKFPPQVQIVDSVVDFKHYFSVSVEYMKRSRPSQFVAKIGDLYREDICQRFAAYLSRIGLPNEPAAILPPPAASAP